MIPYFYLISLISISFFYLISYFILAYRFFLRPTSPPFSIYIPFFHFMNELRLFSHLGFTYTTYITVKLSRVNFLFLIIDFLLLSLYYINLIYIRY